MAAVMTRPAPKFEHMQMKLACICDKLPKSKVFQSQKHSSLIKGVTIRLGWLWDNKEQLDKAQQSIPAAGIIANKNCNVELLRAQSKIT